LSQVTLQLAYIDDSVRCRQPRKCVQQVVDVVVQFKDTRNLQPHNVELNAFLFFLLLLIVLSFRSDEDHSPSGPVYPSRGTDDALNLLAALAPSDKKYIRADSCSGRTVVGC